MAKAPNHRSRDLVWRIELLAFDAFAALFRRLPIDFASGVGGSIFRALGPLTSTQRIVEHNIDIAFPNLTPPERKALLQAQWDNVGRTFMEFAFVDRLTPASGRVEVVGLEKLHEIAREKRAEVLVGGHFANWEVLAIAIVSAGIECQVTYRHANNPYIDRRIIESRRRYGVRLFAPKGGEGAKQLLEAMDRGESVGIMNDQKFNGGVEAPFFGRLAHTAAGPTRLALRHTGWLQPMSVQRLKGARFRVTVHDRIQLRRSADRSADIDDGVRKINAFIEDRVREKPEDWFWVHKRWPTSDYQ